MSLFFNSFSRELEKLSSYHEAKREILARRKDVKVRKLPRNMEDVGSMFNPSENTIYLSSRATKPEALHELGHREQSDILTMAPVLTPSTARVSGLMAAASIPLLAKSHPLARFAIPALLGAAGYTPTLLSELSASARARKMIEKGERGKAVKKDLGPAFATYLREPAITAVELGAAGLLIPPFLRAVNKRFLR